VSSVATELDAPTSQSLRVDVMLKSHIALLINAGSNGSKSSQRTVASAHFQPGCAAEVAWFFV
jgi:hypothetical protein